MAASRESSANLDRLLAAGRVQVANRLVRRAPATFGHAEVAGRFVEIAGVARLTLAAALLRDAQRQRETAVWITAPVALPFPPDLLAWGVDLEALVVVRVETDRDALYAADEVLRSGAFGFVAIDAAGLFDRPPPLAAQVRLAGAAQQHDAVFLYLSESGTGSRVPTTSRPRLRRVGDGEDCSLASLRLVTFRRDLGEGRFEVGFEAVKDKRRGRCWTHTMVCDGTPGLR